MNAHSASAAEKESLILLISGSEEETIKKLVGLIECELGELPCAKVHCPQSTVQAFLEAVMQYQEKEGESRSHPEKN